MGLRSGRVSGYSEDSQPKPTESFKQGSDVAYIFIGPLCLVCGEWIQGWRDAEVDAHGREKRLSLEPKGREATPVHWA